MDVAFEPLTLQSAMVSLFLFQLASPQQRGPFVSLPWGVFLSFSTLVHGARHSDRAGREKQAREERGKPRPRRGDGRN